LAVKISCDKCGKDISTVHSGFDEYKFHLSYSCVPNTQTMRYAVYITPPLPGDMVFCSLQCLLDWLKEHLHVEK